VRPTVRIAVASGKGGTGKTTVALGLALVADSATLVDCDVEEPDDHIFLGDLGQLVEEVTIPVARVDEGRCDHCGECARACAYGAIAVLKDRVMVSDEMCHGCGACGIVCPRDAVTEERRRIGEVTLFKRDGLRLFTGMLDVGQPLATPLIARLKELVGRGGLQILDSPPGTACPVVETIGDADFCLMVTEPTPFGLFDLTMAVEMVRELDVPFAVVVNRDRDDFPDLDAYLEREGIPVLMRIPDSVDIARLYSRGVHFVDEMPEWEERFKDLLVRVIAGGGAS
jgi:MinD superfamily P-loop ATPase